MYIVLFTLIVWICDFKSDASFVVILAEITGRVTPHARPNAIFDAIKTYGTFYSTSIYTSLVHSMQLCLHKAMEDEEESQ